MVSSTLRRETQVALLKCSPGYSRIILAGLALHYMSYHPKYCTLLYCISCLLDAVDGQAARALGQTSKFGAVLDMVTDRCDSRHWHIPYVNLRLKVHHFLSPMLPLVSVPNLRSILPIFDFPGLCEPLYAHVQASETQSSSMLLAKMCLALSLLDREVISWSQAT